MKKSRFFAVALFLLIPHAAYAGTSPQPLHEGDLQHWKTYTWEQKLKRGASNTFTWPSEVVYSVQRMSAERGKGKGWSIGLLEGSGRGFKRFFYGIVELFTFPFGFPDEEKAPIMEPEFAWQRKAEVAKARGAL